MTRCAVLGIEWGRPLSLRTLSCQRGGPRPSPSLLLPGLSALYFIFLLWVLPGPQACPASLHPVRLLLLSETETPQHGASPSAVGVPGGAQAGIPVASRGVSLGPTVPLQLCPLATGSHSREDPPSPSRKPPSWHTCDSSSPADSPPRTPAHPALPGLRMCCGDWGNSGLQCLSLSFPEN